MRHSSKVYSLYYSRLFSVPILEGVLYNLEIWLFSKGFSFPIVASARDSVSRDRLFRIVYQSQHRIVCKSMRFGRLLRSVSKTVILDVTAHPSTLTTDQLYSLMWSLVFSTSVTRQTKASLGRFLPDDFPITDYIVIPCHEDLQVGADYIVQTAKTLAQQEHFVYLIPFHPHVSWFPKRLQRLHNRFTLWVIAHRIRHLPSPVVWSFDQEDLELIILVRSHAMTTYDCVDYLTTLDPSIDTILKRREEQLIKTVDICVVNSHALKRIKSSLRRDIHVVPQGFDEASFAAPNQVVPSFFDNIPRPRIGFVGSLTYRLDFGLLFPLIKELPNVSFVFVGSFLSMPFDDPFVDTEKQLVRLRLFPNVYVVSQVKDRRRIKAMISGFDICMIPYTTRFAFNRYCYPMKLFEYFYMGKPVVSTPIEELKQFPKYVKIGKTAQEWKKHIEMLLSHPWPKKYKEAQRRLAEENSWERKVEAILTHLT